MAVAEPLESAMPVSAATPINAETIFMIFTSLTFIGGDDSALGSVHYTTLMLADL